MNKKPSDYEADVELATRQNIKRSRAIVLIAFFINAALNFALLGYFARRGGLDLVGQWATLNTILSTVIIADFGVTNALTFRIGRDGVANVEKHLRTLLATCFVVLSAISVMSTVALASSSALVFAILVTSASAVLQLTSNWLIAIRMGQHEQYWFNVKTILRVFVQTALAAYLQSRGSLDDIISFCTAILCAAVVEIIFSAALVKGAWTPIGPLASLRDISDLVKGFGLLTLCQRGQQPLLQLVTLNFAGPSVLASFIVAGRVPMVIAQSVSEALRALLPGLAGMTSSKDRHRVLSLLADGINSQILLIFPAILLLIYQSDQIIELWMGEESETIQISMILLSLGVFANCLCTPHFWAVQAMGGSVPLARQMIIRVSLTTLIGSISLFLLPYPTVMPLIFSSSLVAGAIWLLYLSHKSLNILLPCLNLMNWRAIAFYISLTIILNTAVKSFGANLEPSWSAMLGISVNALVLGPIAFKIARDRDFRKKETRS